MTYSGWFRQANKMHSDGVNFLNARRHTHIHAEKKEETKRLFIHNYIHDYASKWLPCWIEKFEKHVVVVLLSLPTFYRRLEMEFNGTRDALLI